MSPRYFSSDADLSKCRINLLRHSQRSEIAWIQENKVEKSLDGGPNELGELTVERAWVFQ